MKLKNTLYRLARSIRNGGSNGSVHGDPEENFRAARDGYLLSFYSQTTR